MKNKILLLFILLSVPLVSCNVLKHTVKDTSSVDKRATAKTDQQTTTLASTQTNLTEKNSEKITETIDTTLSTPEKKISGANSGQTIFIDNGDQTIEATYDSKTNTIKAMGTIKAKEIPVHKEKITERSSDILQDQQKQEDIKSTASTVIKENSKEENKKTDTWIHRTPSIWLLLLIPLAAGIYFAIRKFKMPL